MSERGRRPPGRRSLIPPDNGSGDGDRRGGREPGPRRDAPAGRRRDGGDRGAPPSRTRSPERRVGTGGGGPTRGPSRPPAAAGPGAPPVIAVAGELVYGRNAVAESLRGRRQAHRLLLAEGAREDDRLRALVAAADAAEAMVVRVPRVALDAATGGANHQGVALDVSTFTYGVLDDVVSAEGTVLVLDHLQDPQNFGTLLRAAEACAVAAVVIPQDRAVAVTPAVVNASAGAVEHLTVAMVPNLARALDVMKDGGRWVVGLAEGPGSVDLFTTDVPTPVALVVGSEGHGIGPNVARRCDLMVSLPMRGRVPSLNAATAGAVVLFELLRREPSS